MEETGIDIGKGMIVRETEVEIMIDGIEGIMNAREKGDIASVRMEETGIEVVTTGTGGGMTGVKTDTTEMTGGEEPHLEGWLLLA